MNYNYVCYECNSKYIRANDDNFCPFCGKRIDVAFGAAYIDKENELREAERRYNGSLEMRDRVTAEFAKNIKELRDLDNKYGESFKFVEKFCEENKVDIKKLQEELLGYIEDKNLFDKYCDAFGEDYLKEKVVFDNGKSGLDKYYEFIYLPEDERKKYDEISGMFLLNLSKDSSGKKWYEKIERGIDELIVEKKDTVVAAYPGLAICRDNFNEKNGIIFGNFFDQRSNYIETDDKEKDIDVLKAEIRPAELIFEDGGYIIKNKGLITYNKIIKKDEGGDDL